MDLLPLDDPRWIELDHRNWRDGKPARWAPDAPFIPDELAKLVENPADQERFMRLWPYVCCESSTYAAAYAAVPYLVKFAKQLRRGERFNYLCVIGLIVANSRPSDGKSYEIKSYLAKGYREALSEAMTLILETLTDRHDAMETRYLLGAVSALKGHGKLALVLQDMDVIYGECPKCGETVYPEELREAISRVGKA